MIQFRRNGSGRDRSFSARSLQWGRMLKFLRPYKLRLSLAFIATVAGAALSLVFPEVIQRVVDSVLEQGNGHLLNQVTLFLIFVFLLRAFASGIERYFLNWVGERVVVDVRTALFHHLLNMSLRFYSEHRVGELASRLSSDVTVMRSLLVNNVNTLIQQSLVALGAVGVMLFLNWRLTLFIVGLIPLLVIAGFVTGIYLRRYSVRRQDELANALIVTEEVFQGIRETKGFVRERFESERHDSAIWRSFDATLMLIKLRALFGPAVIFLGLASLAAILWFGGQEVLAGRLSGGELIQFLFYGVTVAASFGALVNLYTQFEEAIGATRRIFDLLDTGADIVDAPGAISLQTVEGRITFDDVYFAYEPENVVLSGINLDIAPGEIVALVGPSGAGKSTMFNLIPRFYDPDAGAVCVDGIDVRMISADSLRHQIGIVSQETLLFGGTIRENIRYGRLTATDEEIFAAATAANAHTFISELPAGYETIVGERGMKLSGGQRQRVAIARAILKDPCILLLDEATSSLDNESEYLVQEALARLLKDRTTVIIAHRLSTVRIADRIAVLNHGSIVQSGTHDQLMAEGGLYKNLYEMQFRDQENLVVALNR